MFSVLESQFFGETPKQVLSMSPHRAKDISLFARFLRGYLRSNLRGQTRLTLLFARYFRSLQFVPITVGDCKPFYIDLSKGRHELLVGAPWEETPWEQSEQHVMKNTVLKGDVVFDVGANIGLHTVLLSKLAGKNGKLFVFEPNTELLPQLTVTLEGLGNAVLFPFALSNKSEVATLFVPENAEMGSLADWTAGRDDVGTTHTIDCEVRRLDDLVNAGIVPLPDFIKCDAEGAELLIFQGGEKTLNRTEE